MRTYIVLAVIIGSGFASPIQRIEEDKDFQRTKKTHSEPSQSGFREDEHLVEEHKARTYYDSSLSSLSAGSGAYGAGLSSGIGLGAGSYGVSGAGYAGSGTGLSTSIGLGGGSYSGAASGHSYSAPSSAGYSGSSVSGYGAGLSGGVHGPALGVFPNAHISACNVPLLLSCAPNVVSGHLALHSHAYAAPAYRSFEEDVKKEAEWAQARKASHHVVSQDYPEPHPGNHHVVSQDYPEPNVTRIIPVHPQNEKTEKLEKIEKIEKTEKN